MWTAGCRSVLFRKEVFWGEDFGVAVGSGKVRGGSNSSVRGEGVKRVEPQRERDGGDYFHGKIDGNIKH